MSKSVEILMVEDNPADVRLTQVAFAEGRLHNRLHVVKDGVEAMGFLRKEGEYAEVPRPDLVLLDLNLPRKNGRQVLAEMKEDSALRSIPVVVLTTSKAEEDMEQSYHLHANCYVVKPIDVQEFIGVVHSIEHFWFEVVSLPPLGRS